MNWMDILKENWIRWDRLSILTLVVLLSSCFGDESLDIDQQAGDEPVTALDIYIDDNFTQEYGMAVRYRYDANFVSPGQRVTPAKIEAVRPMLDFIEDFWIDAYEEVTNGETFFRQHVPAELIFLGGLIYNGDGTVTLGTADAGARVTFTDVNSIDVDDQEWVVRQLHTTYHEFAHIVHQKYKLPTAYEDIAPDGYTGPGSWFILTDEEALVRGFVSPYSTVNPNEDFAEVIAFYSTDIDYFTKYITPEADCQTALCEERNKGRLLIVEKTNAALEHYKKVTGVDLEDIRAAVLSRYN